MRLQHDEPGQRIAGKYQLLEVAGQGGMALVWRAAVDQRGHGRTIVAVKRLLPELLQSPPHVSMFEEEGRVGLKLRHPDIVDTLDFGREPDGRLYLVMEWVEGLDLRRILTHYRKSGRSLGWPVVAHMGRKLLSALAAAHEYTEDDRPIPIFHRDVSPQNIMVADGGAIKLSDFGLARAMDRGSMTNPNIIKGKLSYMAPEQVIGKPATAQTDIFSVGVILWEALVGRKLFRGESDMDLVMAVRNAVVPPLRELRPDTPEALATAIERALARDARKRFPTAREMGRAIEAALDFRNQRVAPTTVGRIVDEVKKTRAAQRQAPEYVRLVGRDDEGPPMPDDQGGDPIPMGESWPEVITSGAPGHPSDLQPYTPPSQPLSPVLEGSLHDFDDPIDDPITQPGTEGPSALRTLGPDEPGGDDEPGGYDEHTVAEEVAGLLGNNELDLGDAGEAEGPDPGDLPTMGGDGSLPALGATALPILGAPAPPTLGGTELPTLGGTGYPTMAGIVERRQPDEPVAPPDPDVTPGPRRPLRRR